MIRQELTAVEVPARASLFAGGGEVGLLLDAIDWAEGEYHQAPHRGLDGQSPAECWALKSSDVTLSGTDLSELFLWQRQDQRVPQSVALPERRSVPRAVALSTGNVIDMYKTIAWELGVPSERNRAGLYVRSAAKCRGCARKRAADRSW